jgi:hypothetical protein
MKLARALLACVLAALACAPLIGLEEAEEITPDAAGGADSGAAGSGGAGCVQPCELPNAVARCEQGRCRLAECKPGWEDCDLGELNHEATGCETNIAADPKNCGACGRSCQEIEPGRSFVCKAGVCVPSGCPAGKADCDGDSTCETDLTSVQNCGFCGNVCGAAAGGSPVCSDGVCGVTCNPPLVPCAQGCVDRDADSRNCGACGNDCGSHPNVASASCSGGRCSYTCNSGYGDCSALPGCETPVTASSNCGTCGNTCTGGRLCSEGRCVCAAGMIECGGSCQDCSGGRACVSGVCQCPSGTKFCNGICQSCCTSSDCSGGKICTSGLCACSAGQYDCAGSCRECCSNAHCSGGRVCQSGACRCPSGTTDCAGGCRQCCDNADCPGTWSCCEWTCTAGVCP